MKEKRDIKVGIKSDKEFFDELKDLAGRIDGGWMSEKPVERLYFDDLPSLLKHLTPKRFELLAELLAELRGRAARHGAQQHQRPGKAPASPVPQRL
jgi:predicted transcriptional regulator